MIGDFLLFMYNHQKLFTTGMDIIANAVVVDPRNINDKFRWPDFYATT